MKKILLIAVALCLVAGTSSYAQKDKVATPNKAGTQNVVKPVPVSVTTPDKAAPQEPGMVRPKMTKQDSLKRQHRIDSLRKVMADRRAKGEMPVLTKQDSIKRAQKIDSLKKAARERNKMNQNAYQSNRPKMSKADSLKFVHKMDSLKKAAAAQKGKQPVPPAPAKKVEKK